MFLGLDLSRKATGVGLVEMLRPDLPRIELDVWDCDGDDFTDNCMVLADHLTRFVRGLRGRGRVLQLAGIEAPIRKIPTRKVRRDRGMFAGEEVSVQAGNPHDVMVQQAMAGTAAAILHQFGVPSVLVIPSQWRKGFIGVSFAPRTMAGAKGRKWLKDEAKAKADALGQRLGFTVPDDNAADALGIAFHIAAREGVFLGRLALQPGRAVA